MNRDFIIGKNFRTFYAILAITIATVLSLPAEATAQYSTTTLYPLSVPTGDYFATFGDFPVTTSNQTVSGDYVGDGNAYLWQAPGGAFVNLRPSFTNGNGSVYALGAAGNQQVGFGQGILQGSSLVQAALLWTGTADSAVILNPPGATGATAFATDGLHQVGNVAGSAALWTGTAESFVNLSPAGYGYSRAFGVSGNQQVGEASISLTGNLTAPVHAMLWSGSAASAVDLAPNLPWGFYDTEAVGTDGTQQVGWGNQGTYDNEESHALLWNGTAASAVDLNPTNFSGTNNSEALATNGTEQVGYYWGTAAGGNASDPHAIAWFGTAASAIDLQSFLPADGTWNSSQAFTVDNNGDIYGTALGTVNGVFTFYAIEWLPVPEPASFGIVAIAGIIAFFRPQHGHRASRLRPAPSTSPAR